MRRGYPKEKFALNWECPFVIKEIYSGNAYLVNKHGEDVPGP